MKGAVNNCISPDPGCEYPRCLESLHCVLEQDAWLSQFPTPPKGYKWLPVICWGLGCFALKSYPPEHLASMPTMLLASSVTNEIRSFDECHSTNAKKKIFLLTFYKSWQKLASVRLLFLFVVFITFFHRPRDVQNEKSEGAFLYQIITEKDETVKIAQVQHLLEQSFISADLILSEVGRSNCSI